MKQAIYQRSEGTRGFIIMGSYNWKLSSIDWGQMVFENRACLDGEPKRLSPKSAWPLDMMPKAGTASSCDEARIFLALGLFSSCSYLYKSFSKQFWLIGRIPNSKHEVACLYHARLPAEGRFLFRNGSLKHRGSTLSQKPTLGGPGFKRD